jgi:hypothetical protein
MTNVHREPSVERIRARVASLTGVAGSARMARSNEQGGSGMSVMMGLRVKADPDRFMEVVRANADVFMRVSEKAKGMGCKAHRFYGGNDEVLVVDEWDTEQAFLDFFGSTEEIGQVMGEAGVTEQPTPLFWRELDTPDAF